MEESNLKILFAAAECAPFFKTGGLGDVAAALPKELVKKGLDCRVVLPFHHKMSPELREQCEDLFHFTVSVGWRNQYCGIKRLVYAGVTYYFIDNEYYFARDGLYGYDDDGERFAFFQLAIMEMMERVHFIPDVLHANDYHTALLPFLVKEKYRWIQSYNEIKTILTIHNIEFQGWYAGDKLADWFGVGMERYEDGTLRMNNCLNYMKGGILYADRVNTVSPTYAQEIQTPEFGAGLDVILCMESGKLSGIVNGIDYDANNPETDPLIAHHFTASDFTGKKANKADLQKAMGLPVKDVPLLAVVSRLTRQKGFHLLLEELPSLLQQEMQLVVLGTGDYDFEQAFKGYAQAFPDKISANITFDVALAQRMYAGADIFLMPSAFEPCGLSQMMAMRYGTLPVVHEIGGLRDTVTPFNPVTGRGTGFGFQDFSGYQFMKAMEKAVTLYRDKPIWQQVMKQAMEQDFSWQTACNAYLALYEEVVTN